MTSDFIRSVTEADFEYEVIAFSRQTPVLVDFWAEWCSPCRSLGPMLERLAEEAQGSFRLAKVDVDANPNLAIQFGVRSIPVVKAFRDGQVVSEFVGTLPEPRVREFLRTLAPSQTDLMLEKAQSLLDEYRWASAEGLFRQFLAKTPHHPAATLGLLKSAIMQTRFSEAVSLLQDFPSSKEFAAAQTIRPLLDALNALQRSPAYSEDSLEAAYLNALWLLLHGNIPAALDGLLEILRQDKHYRNNEVRKVVLGIFEILGDNSLLTQQYRRELALILF
jgi:putative thioredoxin